MGSIPKESCKKKKAREYSHHLQELRLAIRSETNSAAIAVAVAITVGSTITFRRF